MPTISFDFDGITNGLELNVGQTEFAKLAGSSSNTITVNSGALDFTSPASNNLPATYAYETSATDHEFSATYAATGKSGSFITCCIAIVDYRNMLGARFSASTTLELVSLVNSTPTALASTTITRTANDVVRVTRVGTLVTVYVNDVQKLQVTTSAHSTGTKVGFCCRSSTVAGVITASSVIYVTPKVITSANGGNAIKCGATFTAPVTGFTNVTGGTLGGKALTGVSFSAGTVTATAPTYVNGGTFYSPDTNQDLILTFEAETATLSVPTAAPDTYLVRTIASPDSSNPSYLAVHMSPAPLNTDKLISTILWEANTNWSTATYPITVPVWHWKASNSMMTEYTVTLDVTGVIIVTPSLDALVKFPNVNKIIARRI